VSIRILIGDVREQLRLLPADSFDCVVTSPPYWGLRDYGTANWEGGDAACGHVKGPRASDKSTLAGYTSENVKMRNFGISYSGTCGKCGAVRVDHQIGLEPTYSRKSAV
jgi:DNA modification methylase